MDPVAARPTILERSRTALPLGAGVRPNPVTILASRRTQSVSNPVNVPPPLFPSDLSRSNTALGRGNTMQLARSHTTSAGVTHLRVRTPQGTPGGIAGVAADGSRAGRETGTATSGPPTALRSRPSVRRPKGQGAPQAAQQAAPQPPPQSLQPGRNANAIQGMTPLVLPAVPTLAQEGQCSFPLFIVYYFEVFP